MATTKDKLAFVHAMARHTRATVRQCEALLRYSAALWMLERDYSLKSIAKRDRIRQRVAELCGEITRQSATTAEFAARTAVNWWHSDARRMYAKEPVWLEPARKISKQLEVPCVPVFDGAMLKIRTADGEEIVCPS